jgi:putative transposase
MREARGLLAAGKSVEEACRALGVSAAPHQHRKSHYGGVKKNVIKRLRELEKENARLKRAVADLSHAKMITLKAPKGTQTSPVHSKEALSWSAPSGLWVCNGLYPWRCHGLRIVGPSGAKNSGCNQEVV